MSDLKRINTDFPSGRWIREHLDYPHSEWCLIWPFSRNESGRPVFGCPSVQVHRVMCEYRHGPAPEGQPWAAHECGNGHLACANPNHVTWKSTSENLRDIARHGRRQQRFKLTPEKIDEIRALKDRARPADIAEQFGVTPNTIRDILAGRIWRNRNQRFRVLTPDVVLAIRGSADTAGVAATTHGVTRSVVDRIRQGKSYTWVTHEYATEAK